MKKFVFMCIMASALSVFAQEKDVDLQIVNIANITCAELEDILNEENENVVLEFSSGMNIPLQFFLKTENIGHVVIDTTFYMRSAEDDIQFSLDLAEWISLDNFFREDDSDSSSTTEESFIFED
ncbi:MAG: hypothetical protein JSS09_01495 [Verrucomicrobia bacterium]|nr:hypothetical protein [Verrucomicrobiota bacterium]